MSNPQETLKKRLEGKTKYEYCPFCISTFIKDGIEYKDKVPPLFLIKTEEYIPEADKYYQEKYWFCDRCQKRITENIMLDFYASRFDRTRFRHDSKPFLQRIKGSDETIKVYISKEDQMIKKVQ